MQFSVGYYVAAKIDAEEAKAWYREQKPGLEKRFAQAVKTTILKLQKNPFAYSFRYKNIRVSYTKVFPYGIYFYIDETSERIVIVAIIHNKRDRNEVFKRID